MPTIASTIAVVALLACVAVAEVPPPSMARACPNNLVRVPCISDTTSAQTIWRWVTKYVDATTSTWLTFAKYAEVGQDGNGGDWTGRCGTGRTNTYYINEGGHIKATVPGVVAGQEYYLSYYLQPEAPYASVEVTFGDYFVHHKEHAVPDLYGRGPAKYFVQKVTASANDAELKFDFVWGTYMTGVCVTSTPPDPTPAPPPTPPPPATPVPVTDPTSVCAANLVTTPCVSTRSSGFSTWRGFSNRCTDPANSCTWLASSNYGDDHGYAETDWTGRCGTNSFWSAFYINEGGRLVTSVPGVVQGKQYDVSFYRHAPCSFSHTKVCFGGDCSNTVGQDNEWTLHHFVITADTTGTIGFSFQDIQCSMHTGVCISEVGPPTPVPPAPTNTPAPPPPSNFPTPQPTPPIAECFGACLAARCAHIGIHDSLTVDVTGLASNTHLWGNAYYTEDSYVSEAAVHAGVLAAGETAAVTVRCGGPLTNFAGATKNGVTSIEYENGAGYESFYFVGDTAVTPIPDATPQPPTAPPTPEICYHDACIVNKCIVAGKIFQMRVTGKATNSVWGTEVYTEDSSLPGVVVHFGILNAGETGIVNVECAGQRESFEGSSNNGVTSQSWTSYPYTFRVRPNSQPTPPPAPEGTCTTCLKYRCKGLVGQTVPLYVHGTTYGGIVWGTNAYTDDSHLGMAAVHAGVLQVGQTAIIYAQCGGLLPSYTASIQNTILSDPYGPYDGSVTLSSTGTVAPTPCTDRCLHNMCAVEGSAYLLQVTGTTSVLYSAWGEGPFTDDSDVQLAAVHSGLVADGETKTLLALCTGRRTHWFGSTKNGATTQTYAATWDFSFVLKPYTP